jgi:hypothetical protein
MDESHQIHTNHDPGIQYQILLFWVGAAHISYAPSLSFDILDKWNMNTHFSKSFVRPGYVMVFLIVCSFLFYIHGTRTVLLVVCLNDLGM